MTTMKTMTMMMILNLVDTTYSVLLVSISSVVLLSCSIRSSADSSVDAWIWSWGLGKPGWQKKELQSNQGKQDEIQIHTMRYYVAKFDEAVTRNIRESQRVALKWNSMGCNIPSRKFTVISHHKRIGNPSPPRAGSYLYFHFKVHFNHKFECDFFQNLSKSVLAVLISDKDKSIKNIMLLC